MRKINVLFALSTPLLLILSSALPVSAGSPSSKDIGYQTGFIKWSAAAGDFANWSLDGVAVTDMGALSLDAATAARDTDPYPAGSYHDRNFYNGSTFLVGEAIGPEETADFGFTQAIASWNADTPDGTWVETLMRARIGGVWTKFYNMGVWASGTGTVARHSVNAQSDADGYVSVDTLIISGKKVAADGFQLKARLFSADGTAIPTIRNLSVAYSTNAPKKVSGVSAGNPGLWNTKLDVPLCSQMVYKDGGNVWCSPTSVSMVMGYYGYMPGECEPRVRDAVAGVYDWLYDGHGNWPFNTAYAASQVIAGTIYDAYVARFTGLDQAEPWVKAGVPVVMSLAWGKGDLTNATVGSTSGHLVVLVGFDANGDAIVNDPAASEDADVQRTYLRSEFEPLWLQSSGGTVYLIYPEGIEVPGL